MFGWLKRKLGTGDATKEASDRSRFLEAVTENAINRRAAFRVRYPRTGPVGGLPHIEWTGPLAQTQAQSNLRIIDISSGGFLLKDAPLKDLGIGARYDFKFVCHAPNKEINQTARLVNRRGPYWHFQFEEMDPSLLVRTTVAAKAGSRGAQTRMLKGKEFQAPGKELLEGWVNESGDGVMFFTPEDSRSVTKAEITYSNQKLSFSSPVGFRMDSSPAPQQTIEEIYLFLSNIRKPSERLQALLKEFEKQHRT